jgi:hypothetical protein
MGAGPGGGPLPALHDAPPRWAAAGSGGSREGDLLGLHPAPPQQPPQLLHAHAAQAARHAHAQTWAAAPPHALEGGRHAGWGALPPPH